MSIYVVITVVTIILAYYVEREQRVINGLETRQQMGKNYAYAGIFVVLFSVGSLRYFVGWDYGAYLDVFEQIYHGEYVSTEVGFNTLVQIAQYCFGQNTFIPIFAVVSGVTAYYMIKSVKDQMDWFFYGFMLFMLSGFYFLSFNTIRYYVAFALVMYATKYVLKKDYLPFIFYVLVGATIHKTCLLVLPVYWFARRKWSKWEYGLIGVGAISFLLFEEFYRDIIFMIYPYYEDSVFDTGATSLFNIVKCLAVLIFALLVRNIWKEDERLQFYFKLNLIGLVVYACCSFMPVVSRIAYYFVWAQIFLLTNILVKMKESRWKKICTVGIIVAYGLVFLLLLGEMQPYQTWIGATL